MLANPPETNHWRSPLRWLAAIFFVAAGISHFLSPGSFRRIVPPIFPAPHLLVAISGACEIAGGAGLLIRPLRRPAAWGLIALLIAVFPANIHMALAPGPTTSGRIPVWLLWLRLPLQPVMIAWVWFVSFATPESLRVP
jgi:uncharacterized membrane protein